jgi:hypothetical protein
MVAANRIAAIYHICDGRFYLIDNGRTGFDMFKAGHIARQYGGAIIQRTGGKQPVNRFQHLFRRHWPTLGRAHFGKGGRMGGKPYCWQANHFK